MIPPESMIQDESGDKEEDRDQGESPKSPGAGSQQETKLQRLKRSLSFKTKSIRSKSADNFFRNSSENKTELLSDVSSSTGHLCTIGMAPPAIPSAPPAIPSAPPPTSRPQARNPLHDSAGHCFMEHIFKKPTFCDVCNHMIVGTTAKHVVFLAGNTAKHGLRCKACKMSLHHKCENGVGQQRCMGKLPKGFRRYYSSPLLIQEQYGCIKEVMPIACGNKVDPVYEALRFGTSLAQKAKRASGSESPHHNSLSDLDNVPEEAVAHGSKHELCRKQSDDVFTVLENGIEHYFPHVSEYDNTLLEPTQLHRLKLDTYVALYSYTAQETHDLDVQYPEKAFRNLMVQVLPLKKMGDVYLNYESQRKGRFLTHHLYFLAVFLAAGRKLLRSTDDGAGDRILLADDSNGDWWKGVIEDRMGYFPAGFAHQVRGGDQVYRCNRTFIGCKEQGQITLKEGQICVSSEEEHSGFLRVESGKKRGYVPCDVLDMI